MKTLKHLGILSLLMVLGTACGKRSGTLDQGNNTSFGNGITNPWYNTGAGLNTQRNLNETPTGNHQIGDDIPVCSKDGVDLILKPVQTSGTHLNQGKQYEMYTLDGSYISTIHCSRILGNCSLHKNPTLLRTIFQREMRVDLADFRKGECKKEEDQDRKRERRVVVTDEELELRELSMIQSRFTEKTLLLGTNIDALCDDTVALDTSVRDHFASAGVIISSSITITCHREVERVIVSYENIEDQIRGRMPSKSTYRKAIIEVEFASAEEKWKAFEKLNKSKGGDIFDMLENPLK